MANKKIHLPAPITRYSGPYTVCGRDLYGSDQWPGFPEHFNILPIARQCKACLSIYTKNTTLIDELYLTPSEQLFKWFHPEK